MARPRSVGEDRFLRVGTPQIVTGEARYAGDLRREDMLFAKAVRSTLPHATIRDIRLGEALCRPGVAAILTAADIPGENAVGLTSDKSQPVLAETIVRFRGEAVALVIAETKTVAVEVAGRVVVDYDLLPPVGTFEEAMDPAAPRLRPDGNLAWEGRVVRGDFQSAVDAAAVVVTGTYRTTGVDHAYIETESVFAEPEGDGMRVWVGSKNVHLDRGEIARVLGWPPESVRVIAPPAGGNFGGKPDGPLLCMAALACRATGRPVLMEMDREESLQVSTKRHPVVMHMTHCADKNGSLLGVKMEAYADAGAYLGYTVPVMQRMVIHAAGPYRVDNVLLEGWAYYSTNPSNGAMRGFGVPQVTFAGERQMDRIADALDMEPLELRLLNALESGDLTSTGQVLNGPVGLRDCLTRAREMVGRDGRRVERRGTKRHGWGVACFYYGNGLTAMPNTGRAVLRLLEGGRIQLAVGSPDVGQGSNLTLGQLAAETLGLEVSDIEVLAADTALTPDSGSASGTRLVYVVGNAVVAAATSFREELLERAAAVLGSERSAFSLESVDGRPTVAGAGHEILLGDLYEELGLGGALLEGAGTFDPPTTALDRETGQGAPYGAYTFGVQLAKVAVDSYTGKTDVESLVAVVDAGTIVNPSQFAGQMQGGCAMGLGYALLEEVQLEQGRVVNDNFDRYLLPTTLDMPEVSLATVQTVDATGPFGAKGVGEPALVPTAAAIANAVARAGGIHVDELPMSLERVSDAFRRREEEGGL